MNKILKKIIPFIITALIAIMITGILAPKVDFLSNKEVKKSKEKIKKLEKVNKKLKDKNKILSKEEKKWENIANDLKDSIKEKQRILELSRQKNKIIKEKIDSLNKEIIKVDSNLIEIEKDIYETISNNDSLSINEYYEFFSEYLNRRK